MNESTNGAKSTGAGAQGGAGKPPKTWDIPTRVFHWLLAVLVVAALYTGERDPMPDLAIHRTIGLVIVGLLIFRLIWGFVGNAQARFANYPLGRHRLNEDAQGLLPGGKLKRWPGHGPLGAAATVIMLAVLFVQVGTGLFADNDVLATGPLARHFPAVSRPLALVHEVVSKLVFLLVLVHLLAVIWHQWGKKHRIIGAMFTGRRPAHRGTKGEGESEGAVEEEAERPGHALAAISAAALICLLLYSLY